MPINANPEYISAEKKFSESKTDDEKLLALEEMIRFAPSHKGGENLRADLKARYKKFKERLEEKKKRGKRGKEGIKKEDMQAVFIGLTNSGKSSLISCLTNAKPIIGSYDFTTKMPVLGTMNYENVRIQLIDLPALESEYTDQGIINTADTLLVIITKISDLEKIFPFLQRAVGRKIIIFNKSDALTASEKRKVHANLSTKKYNFVIVSCKTNENIEILKKKIWESFDKIRIYTKQPGKPADKEPVILDIGAEVKDAADKIFHGFSEKIKETTITGPSSKFTNQKVGPSHRLKDKDIIEFRLKN
ncbi:hypothetical protein COV15_02800 [Candidatus Woesearchaeota archaeon CG10_big_fil_rev_8_21_14_0_10_34_12]|nr:MAG: hypothetical protein COV15_02800 [Candidatus Woesearchaeota archaeon CG10_big_fil_rev_8_21_14_0_10_34_12]